MLRHPPRTTAPRLALTDGLALADGASSPKPAAIDERVRLCFLRAQLAERQADLKIEKDTMENQACETQDLDAKSDDTVMEPARSSKATQSPSLSSSSSSSSPMSLKAAKRMKGKVHQAVDALIQCLEPVKDACPECADALAHVHKLLEEAL